MGNRGMNPTIATAIGIWHLLETLEVGRIMSVSSLVKLGDNRYSSNTMKATLLFFGELGVIKTHEVDGRVLWERLNGRVQ